MKHRLTAIAGVLCLGLASLGMTGCLAVAAAGAAGTGVAYARGDLEVTVDATPQQVVAAADRAFAELNLAPVSSAASSLDGTAIARTADDEKITVKVKTLTKETSKLSVRVGTFGDDAVAERVIESIRANLSAGATAAAE